MHDLLCGDVILYGNCIAVYTIMVSTVISNCNTHAVIAITEAAHEASSKYVSKDYVYAYNYIPC